MRSQQSFLRRNCRMCSPEILLLVFLSFYFFQCRSFSPCWPLLTGRWHFSFSHRRYEMFMFFFQRNSPPLFLITHSNPFSVIPVSVDIKNNVEKTRLRCCFFLSKSPRGHAISRQKPSSYIWVAIPVDRVILHVCL